MNRILILPVAIAVALAAASFSTDVVASNPVRAMPAPPSAAVATTIPVPAALASLQLALAQDGYYEDDVSPELESQLDDIEDDLARLQGDSRVRRFASEELGIAEEYIDDLSANQPGGLRASELDRAEALLEDAENAALAGGGPQNDRDVIVVDSDDDELARQDAAQARSDADRARFEAQAAREAADDARRQAEADRGRYAEMEQELRQMKPRETERGLVVTLGDVLFEVDRADLKPSAVKTLNQLVSSMREHADTTVLIEGHTDSTGKRAYNYTLSERRANTVRSFLTRNRIAASRIKTQGLGPDSPVASNATASGRSQNRRVEVILQDAAERAERKVTSRR